MIAPVRPIGPHLVASRPVRRPAPRLRLPLLIVAVLGLLVSGCADDGEIGGPSVGNAVAMRVGDFTYTVADLEEEVELWASNPVFLNQVVQIGDLGTEGRRSAALVTYVLSHRVLSELGRQLAGDDLDVSDDAVEAIVTQVDQQFPDPTTGGPLFGAYDDAFRNQIGTDFVYQDNLLGGGVDLDSADVPEVGVNPRFGEYQDLDRGLGQVIPNEGPRPQASPAGSALGS